MGPEKATILARWILIKEIELVSDSVQDIFFDILGCCGSCPSTPTPTIPTTTPTTSLSTESSSISTTKISTVTPECKEGDILPKDNCTSHECRNGKYVLVKVCNKVCQENEKLIQLDEESCCQCVPKLTTTTIPATITTTPICDNSTEAILC